MKDVYEKIGRKYIKLGYQFTGFPADGIWYVQNGRQSMSCLIGSGERVPVHALKYRMYEKELCDLLMAPENRNKSFMDLSGLCCDFFAGKAGEC